MAYAFKDDKSKGTIKTLKVTSNASKTINANASAVILFDLPVSKENIIGIKEVFINDSNAPNALVFGRMNFYNDTIFSVLVKNTGNTAVMIPANMNNAYLSATYIE